MSHKIAHELGRTYCAPQASRARKTRTNPLCCCSSLVFGRDPRVVVVPLRLASRIVPPIPVLGRVYRALCRKIPQIFLGRQKPRAFPSSDLARTFSSPPLFPCGSVVSCSPVVEKLPTNVPHFFPFINHCSEITACNSDLGGCRIRAHWDWISPTLGTGYWDRLALRGLGN